MGHYVCVCVCVYHSLYLNSIPHGTLRVCVPLFRMGHCMGHCVCVCVCVCVCACVCTTPCISTLFRMGHCVFVCTSILRRTLHGTVCVCVPLPVSHLYFA